MIQQHFEFLHSIAIKFSCAYLQLQTNQACIAEGTHFEKKNTGL